jgi:hypothetical protein
LRRVHGVLRSQSFDELQRYLPPREEPPDFDAFWQATLEEARMYPLNVRFEPYDAGLATVETFDVTFRGYGGQPIKGWLPAAAPQSLLRFLPSSSTSATAADEASRPTGCSGAPQDMRTW